MVVLENRACVYSTGTPTCCTICGVGNWYGTVDQVLPTCGIGYWYCMKQALAYLAYSLAFYLLCKYLLINVALGASPHNNTFYLFRGIVDDNYACQLHVDETNFLGTPRDNFLVV